MTLQLRQRLDLRQEVSLRQVIELSALMAVPDVVMTAVIDTIVDSPDTIESRLKDIVRSDENGHVENKVRTLYPGLVPNKMGGNQNSGLVISPNLGDLSSQIQIPEGKTVSLTPDVIYTGRKSNKPEIYYAGHLNGETRLAMLQLDVDKYPETSRLINRLKMFDDWKRRTLRTVYLTIGEEQREFFEELDRTRFHVFRCLDLSDKLNLSESTLSRLLNNRYAEAIGTNERKEYWSAKELLITQDRLLRYTVIPSINAVFEEEFKNGIFYSDADITKRVRGVARRTVQKYRTEAIIPSIHERKIAYEKKERTTPYKIE